MNDRSNPPPFLLGHPTRSAKPLERYLPPIPEGVAASWLGKNIPRGGLILDPFGAAPSLALESARNGYRVLTAVNNPILAFLLKTHASAPSEDDLTAALAALSSTRLREERLEPHILSLYQTNCRQCNRQTTAEAYLWQKGSPVPYAVIYTCSRCKDTGEYPAGEADKSLAQRFSQSGLHRSRALERVAPLNDPDRVHVEEALETYPNRALHILSTLINKLEGLDLSDQNEDLLGALLLSAFDRANTLWAHPVERERPKQLTIPPKYRENNIWFALEAAVDQWRSSRSPVPVHQHDGSLPPEGSIAMFEGRAKDLAQSLGELPIDAVLTALPRPNQAFWTLSALWTGWLWGADAVQPIKAVLRRARYNWRWHTAALHGVLAHLASNLTAKTPLFSLIAEAEPGFISAGVVAAHQAGFVCRGIALRSEEEKAQISWEFGDQKPSQRENIEQTLHQGARDYLLRRGEPSPYLILLAAGLSDHARSEPLDQEPSEAFQALQVAVETTISYRGGFLRLGATGKSRQSGYWWLQTDDQAELPLPLADRTEIALVRHLLQHPGSTTDSIDQAVCEALPGLMTPSQEMVQICLQSYGTSEEGRWQIRAEDRPGARRADLETMAKHIDELGAKVGFAAVKMSDDPLRFQWYNADGEIEYLLYLIASAVLGKLIPYGQPSLSKTVIILPGGRANLAAYKLAHNPALKEQAEGPYRFVKYRHLRHLLASPMLTRENLDDQLALDPLTYTEPQLRLF
jgi:hypothetical protein